MKLRTCLLTILLILCLDAGSVLGQSKEARNWFSETPSTATLLSRIKHRDKEGGYGLSAFSFRHSLRSDVGTFVTRNNYELLYGNMDLNGDLDWFVVSMVTDDQSRIKDIGELNWEQVFNVPFLPASPEPHKGIRLDPKAAGFAESSDWQIARVIAGHMYVVHSKDRDTDFYTLFRVEKLIPNNEVSISWKNVPSPEK